MMKPENQWAQNRLEFSGLRDFEVDLDHEEIHLYVPYRMCQTGFPGTEGELNLLSQSKVEGDQLQTAAGLEAWKNLLYYM